MVTLHSYVKLPGWAHGFLVEISRHSVPGWGDSFEIFVPRKNKVMPVRQAKLGAPLPKWAKNQWYMEYPHLIPLIYGIIWVIAIIISIIYIYVYVYIYIYTFIHYIYIYIIWMWFINVYKPLTKWDAHPSTDHRGDFLTGKTCYNHLPSGNLTSLWKMAIYSWFTQ